MVMPYIIDGVATVIPGIYTSFYVQNSLPSPAPAGRSVFIFGEAEEGAPGANLDLRLNYFQTFESIRAYYKSGPIVNAARMLLGGRQPGPAFPGSIDRVYVYKTNNSKRAERSLADATYGSLVAARFGEPGNLIRTQVLTSREEALPSKTMKFLPSTSVKDLSVTVNGKVSQISALANEVASDIVTKLDAIPGLSAEGGDSRTVVVGADIDVLLDSEDDTLIITRDAAGTFSDEIQVGDTAYIPAASELAGATGQNVGVYIVTSASSSELRLKQVKALSASSESNVQAFDLTAVEDVTSADLLINADIEVSVDEATLSGSASALEISGQSPDKSALLVFSDENYSNLLSDATSTIADISATVSDSGSLVVSLSLGNWVATPRIGDLVRISRDSILAGANKYNVGTLAVVGATSQSLTLQHLNATLDLEAVPQVALAGQNSTLTSSPSFVSSDLAFRRLNSEQERAVRVNGLQVENNQQTAQVDIGGNVCFEFGYYHALATSATASITTKRELIITPVGPDLTPIRILLNKYNSLESLATYMNSIPSLSARVLNAQDKSRSTRVLDAVQNLGCLQATSLASYPAKLKRDYSDWTQYFLDNPNLLAFRAGSMLNKAGLPMADSAPLFLQGAELGSTNMMSVQNALDAAKKIVVRLVVPLFSRDAVKDILDGLTDENSSYAIDAINFATRAHVSDMSAPVEKKYRHAVLSYHGSLQDTIDHVGLVAHERCQMTFMLSNALDAEGNNTKALPYIEACAIAAARCQARLGTALLRKPFNLSSAEHYGDVSLYSNFDEMTPDFDADDTNLLSAAITAGLLVFRAVPGFGVRLESPDLSTRSRINDPQAWVWERTYILFTCDEVRETVESVLDSYIGDFGQPLGVIRTSISDTIRNAFMTGANAAVEGFQIVSLDRVGPGYKGKVKIKPAECTEYMDIEFEASRDIE